MKWNQLCFIKITEGIIAERIKRFERLIEERCIILRKKEVIAMQMYEVTALAPEGPEEVYQAMVFAEDEDDALNQLEEQLKEQGIAHGMCMAEEV